IQDSNEIDVALVKYRVAAVQTPNSAQLWNNIGMCFFSKTKYIAAVACLKRALYLDPFEWIIAYNLGIAHLSMGQYASAFHYLSASINLKPDFASAYMYLGITLARLGDYDNSCSAYEKVRTTLRTCAACVRAPHHGVSPVRAYLRVRRVQSLSMEADHTVHLNFCISLLNARRMDRAREQYVKFLAAFQVRSRPRRTAPAASVACMPHAVGPATLRERTARGVVTAESAGERTNG
ncbi:tetratricopeptide repeat protein, partial [archaeon]